MSPNSIALTSTSTALALGVGLAGHRVGCRSGSARTGRDGPGLGRAGLARPTAVLRASSCTWLWTRRNSTSCSAAPQRPSSRRKHRSRRCRCAILGDRKKGLSKSSGFSSSQTLSSFCQTREQAVDALGVLDDGGKGRWLARCWRGGRRRAAGGRARKLALPAGARRSRRRSGGRCGLGARRLAHPAARSRRHKKAATAADQGQGRAGHGQARRVTAVTHWPCGCGRRRGTGSAGCVPPCIRAPSTAPGVPSDALNRRRFGRAPSSPRRFFLSASYSW
jgi:hypothetical protein